MLPMSHPILPWWVGVLSICLICVQRVVLCGQPIMHYGLLKTTRSGWEQRLLTYRVHPLCLSSRLFIFLIIVFLFSGINALSLWGLMFSYPQCHLPRGVLVVYLLQGRCVPRWRCAGWCRCWGLLLWSSGRRGCQSSYSSGSSVASFSTSGSRQPLPSLAALRRWTTGRKHSQIIVQYESCWVRD